MSNPAFHAIALAGCPNAGKTALFNRLTGAHQKVANYAGVTVEYKMGNFTTPNGEHVTLYDVPGTYSLTTRSPDEEIARKLLHQLPDSGDKPEVIICVADATNLALHLRFLLELKTLGIPMILALNMADIARRQALPLHTEKLAKLLEIPVVETVAVRKGGQDALLTTIDTLLADASALLAQPHVQHPPTSEGLRHLHKQAHQLLEQAGMKPGLTPHSTYAIDRVLLHPVLGLLALFALMFFMFQAVFTWAEWPMEQIDGGVTYLAELLNYTMPDSYLKSFLTDGVLAGVGSVVIFLPQILILFFFILILEDSGYLARAAFMLDKIMGGAGLSGRSFIPLLSSFACAVPGIMATRTIAESHNRLITMLVAPLMTCSARLPVYTLIIAAFIPARDVYGFHLQGMVMFGLYAAGVVFGMLAAIVLKRYYFKSAADHFVMELPSYKLPSLRNLGFGLFERVKIFIRRAGTIIFTVSIVLWGLVTFPVAPEGASQPILHSAAGILGGWLQPLFAPIGFNWQMVIALIPGLAAREVAIAALGTVYAVSAEGAGLEAGLGALLSQAWSLPTALSFLAWYIFAPQCLSTLAVLKRESGHVKWMWFAVIYLFALAYLAALATYQISALMLAS